MPITLYGREDCHLCEIAAEALRGAGIEGVEEVDVGWSGELARRYGTRIPVLVREDGAELAWPFDGWMARRFLDQA
ncbi:MAG TPA: glutaredoxin family protein [Xanthomonadales bacterium]|nr:glutaredoxin family protein [Xanthomonadales bacterium]